MSGAGSGMRVLCTDRAIHPEAVEALRAEGFEVAFAEAPRPREHVLAALAAHGPVHAMILRGLPAADAGVLAAAPELRILSCHGAGYDTVDLDAATRAGIVVTTSGGANSPAVGEHAFAMIVMLARRLPQLDAQVRRGEWAPRAYLGSEFGELTLGLIGFGNIAKQTARLARAIGMRVIAIRSRPGGIDPALAEEAASIGELVEAADIVSLHAPLTPATRHLVDAALIARMRPGAMLVNTARGDLVDEDALAAALRSGRIGGAALDALSEEPPAPGSPLLGAPNLVFTPHIAALTRPSMRRMGLAAADNVIRLFAGLPLDPALVVNPQALEGRAG